jgi:hypothetical protein
MKKILAIKDQSLAENLIYFGVHDTEEERINKLKSLNIKNIRLTKCVIEDWKLCY